MGIKKFINRRKFLLFNILLCIYVVTNLIGGERGLISYFSKKNIEKKMTLQKKNLKNELQILEKRNSLISKKKDSDYLDMLYRDKLKLGKDNEIIIKLKKYEK